MVSLVRRKLKSYPSNLLRCDQHGDQYPPYTDLSDSAFAIHNTISYPIWHQRIQWALVTPVLDTVKSKPVVTRNLVSYNKPKHSTLVSACQKKLELEPEGSPVTDPTLYRSLAGALQYITFTRIDLSYAVQQLCLYMYDPREPHLNAMKRILRYLRGTTDLGLQLFRSTTSQLIAYSDADWAGCPAMHRSTSRYCVFLGDNLLTWSSKRQDTLSRSSAEAEYRKVANAM
ncbi:ribonuclease H-like domain-containing protein [Tanacetum coccineum]|uniref:Ribonuclease H-like domain-containing protein n=1 Tax=Tanacetum coccineum TaxID=301880 RepID=A0ABQ4WKN5_9ASTR